MALTPSTMLQLGTSAPNFSLINPADDKNYTLEGLKGSKATLVMFICNHCPFVKHVNKELAKIGEDYLSEEVGIIAISSNDVANYPEDSPELMVKNAEEQGFNFPYLYDETQEVAKVYDAACTPDFYIFNGELKLVYRGQLDDSRPGNNVPVTGRDLRDALDNVLAGKEVNQEQKPSIGCNIKWK